MVEEWLTVEEAAARLKVNAETIRRWLRSEKMKGRYLGSTKAGWRISASEVENYQQERGT